MDLQFWQGNSVNKTAIQKWSKMTLVAKTCVFPWNAEVSDSMHWDIREITGTITPAAVIVLYD